MYFVVHKICYSAHSIEMPEALIKRKILSEIAKIYDPLRLLGPMVLFAKRLIQDIWKCGVHWDESVPQHIYIEWLEFTRQLDSINRATSDRKTLLDECRNIQIYEFCDANDIGYEVCSYVSTEQINKL